MIRSSSAELRTMWVMARGGHVLPWRLAASSPSGKRRLHYVVLYLPPGNYHRIHAPSKVGQEHCEFSYRCQFFQRQRKSVPEIRRPCEVFD
eukprot:3975101-Amphidinium_carterae.1